MEENKPLIRPVITPKDIANITGCSLEAATSRYKRLRTKLKKKKGQEVTYEEYCLHADIREERVIPFLRVYPANLLKVAIAASLLMAFCTYAYFEYDCEFFRTHKIEVDERTPNSIKAHTWQQNPDTKQMEKITIEITDTSIHVPATNP